MVSCSSIDSFVLYIIFGTRACVHTHTRKRRVFPQYHTHFRRKLPAPKAPVENKLFIRHCIMETRRAHDPQSMSHWKKFIHRTSCCYSIIYLLVRHSNWVKSLVARGRRIFNRAHLWTMMRGLTTLYIGFLRKKKKTTVIFGYFPSFLLGIYFVYRERL